MSIAEQPVSSASADAATLGGRDARRRPAAPAWAGIAVLVLLSMAVYAVLAVEWQVPVINPDESFYGGLAKSIAHGHGMSWRGEHVSQPSALYMYAISPAWVLASGHTAYLLAKVIGVVVMCTTAIPIWLILRRVAPQWLALAAAALAVMGTWMFQAGALTTETFSLPFGTASLCAAVAAIRQPGSRYIWLALIFGLLATATRFQCVTLLASVWASLLLDVVLAGRGWRRRARQHVWPIVVFTGLLAAGAVMYVTDGTALVGSGSYYSDLTGAHPAVGEMLRRSVDHVAVLGVSAGMLPLSILLACLTRRAAWRDEALRPMLVVALPVAAGLCLQAGYYFAGMETVYGPFYWTSHRYVAYAAPIIIATAVLAASRPRVLDRVALAVAAAALGLLLLLPAPTVLYDERPLFTLIDSVGRILPNASEGHLALAFAGAMAVVWAVLWAVARGRLREARAMSLVAALVLGLVVQSAAAWNRAIDTADRFRSASPADFHWIDHHSTGRVAVMILGDVGGELADMELLNDHVDQIYTFQQQTGGSRLDGRTCRWGIRSDGLVLFEEPCANGSTPRELWVEDPMLRMTFYDERRSAADPHVGRLVTVGSAPRLRAMVRTPCERLVRTFVWNATMEAPPQQDCQNSIDVRLWSDAPGQLRLRFQGAPAYRSKVTIGREDPNGAAAGGTGLVPVRDQAIPEARYTEVTLQVPRGRFRRVIQYGWGQPGDLTPHLLSIELVQGGKRISLL